ncbi:MAG TPA: ABC transporter permease [Candidatus Angelobacter sp.]|nr:ABC transporter permease [Candidatus Angelobacter sp.]
MLNEIRYAFRMIARSPGFTAIAVLSLALGIGANAAIFSLADALVLRPLPVADPSSVMDISTTRPGINAGGVSYPDYRDLRSRAQSFDGLVAYQLSTFSMARTRDEVAHMRMGMLVSDNFFPTLGVRLALGRGFLPEETVSSTGTPTVVLGHDFWNNEFNHDASVIGRTVRISGMDFNVIGVAPRSFTGLDQYIRPSFYVPLGLSQRLLAAAKDPLEDRANHDLSLEGRLHPGVAQRTAQSEMATLWSALQHDYPGPDRARGIAVRTQLQARFASEPFDPVLSVMLMVLASLVLIIACANVANLLLGRARGRSREVAVRMALGVSRYRLLRQLLMENFVLALLGAAFGLVFAFAGIRFLQTIPVPTDLPVVIAPQLDQRVLIASLISALASVLIFGLAPALQSLKIDLIPALKSGDSRSSGGTRTLGRNALVIGQIAMAMVLLVSAGMLLDGFHKALIAGPGFRTDHLMTMEMDTSLTHYNPEQSRTFYRELTQRASALPGVTTVALTSFIPFSPGGMPSRTVAPEGYQFPKGQEGDEVFYGVIDEHFLGAVDIPLISGRDFTSNDKAGTSRVAIVNEEFARHYWPSQDALGKRFRMEGAQGTWVQVVGVARTSKYFFIGESPQRYFYLPYAQDPSSKMVLLAQTPGDPASLAAPLRDVVHSLDVNQPIYNARTFTQFFEMRSAGPKMILQTVAVMGLMGLTLSLIGIYGLVSYSVARRTREIGVRMAIGANTADVIRLVLRQGLFLSLVGITAGEVISLAVGKLISSGFIGLGKPNLATFIVVPIAVLAVTLTACWAPARRASRIDPIRALRLE